MLKRYIDVLVTANISACFYALKKGFVLLCFKSCIFKVDFVENIDHNPAFFSVGMALEL